MKQITKLLLILLCAATLLCAAVPAVSALDRYDAAPGDGAGQPAEAGTDMVWLSSSMYYDMKTREFVYPIGSSDTFVRASVASGMVVAGPVRLTGATMIVYRDGLLYESKTDEITDAGEYVVMAQTGSETHRILTFTLVKETVSTVYAYNLPTGMIVVLATRDGLDTEYERSSVPMQTEGAYHIEYECVATEMHYVLDVTVDRTPPDIQFEGTIDEKHRVHSPLRLTGLKSTDTLAVTLDNVSIDVPIRQDGTAELTQSGNYIINVTDAAGNSSEYIYTIMLYVNSGGLAFFAVLAASILALIIYVIIKRRHLEIG